MRKYNFFIEHYRNACDSINYIVEGRFVSVSELYCLCELSSIFVIEISFSLQYSLNVEAKIYVNYK